MRLLGLSFICFMVIACSENHPEKTIEKSKELAQEKAIRIVGEAQGTTYSIKYFGDSVVSRNHIDSIFSQIDLSLSTWEPSSLISALNSSDTVYTVFDDYNHFFSDNFKIAREVYRETDGALDPTVAPLVNAWGFGFKNKEEITPELIDSLLTLVGFDYEDVRLSVFDDRISTNPERVLVKRDTRIALDFNAFAQGYSADVIGEYLRTKNINSYMIEVGGEILAGDQKPDGSTWKLGIDKPTEQGESRALIATIQLKNKSVVTSGNYRKFYVENGVKYAHTINPKTGYPVKHNLLSATVVHANCGKADAYATAFMVMGLKETMKFLQSHPDIDAYLIYDDQGDLKTWSTDGIKEMIEEKDL